MTKIRVIAIALLLALAAAASACRTGTRGKTIRVGTISGTETQLMEAAKAMARELYHLDVEVIPFGDYELPNDALNEGRLDANMFQHIPFLESQKRAHGYDFSVVGKGFVYPLGLFSKNAKSLDDIPDKGTIAIPDESSNRARALLMLEKSGLIRLKSEALYDAKVEDIADNPKHLKFIERDAALLAESLGEVDAAAINDTYAALSGLKLSEAIYKEGADSLYVNVLVARTQDAMDPRFRNLLAAFQSQAVVDQAKKLFGDGAIPAFKTFGR